jgi:hypothetical protein
MACGVLPPGDRHLLDHEAWLHRRLAAAGGPHEQLLRQFALWHQLPRLRADAAARPLRSTARQYATEQFTAAQNFLDWLHQHGIAPAVLGQAYVDVWAAGHRVHERQYVRGFLTWAITTGRVPRHLTPPRVAFQAGPALTQQRRLALLRCCLTDDQAPVPARAAACLLLLYAQPLTRIHRLTTADLTDASGQMHLRLGDPPSPVPAPFADLLRQLPRTSGSPWLFPGLLPGQPAGYPTMRDQLRDLGLPLRQARISALRQLVLQAPAPVIADALGFHQTTATRQAASAGSTWSRYTAASSKPGPS